MAKNTTPEEVPPVETPIAANPNSTFAERAKRAGKNKRVEESEAK